MAQNQLDVNEHRRTFQQFKRASATNGLQQTFDGPRRNGETKQPWWAKYFKWERNLIVAGRTIEKGWVVPQQLGIALLLMMLSCTGILYWRIIDKQAAQDTIVTEKMQEQRELLIRLDQRLLDKNDHDNQRFDQINDSIESVKAHQAAIESVVNKQLAELKAQR